MFIKRKPEHEVELSIISPVEQSKNPIALDSKNSERSRLLPQSEEQITITLKQKDPVYNSNASRFFHSAWYFCIYCPFLLLPIAVLTHAKDAVMDIREGNILRGGLTLFMMFIYAAIMTTIAIFLVLELSKLLPAVCAVIIVATILFYAACFMMNVIASFEHMSFRVHPKKVHQNLIATEKYLYRTFPNGLSHEHGEYQKAKHAINAAHNGAAVEVINTKVNERNQIEELQIVIRRS